MIRGYFEKTGNSLQVEWLGCHTFTAKGWDSICGWGTKRHKPHSAAKEEKKENRYSGLGPIQKRKQEILLA